MYKKTITYEDLEGNEVTEDFYFNFTKAELAEWELITPGDGLGAYLTRIVNSNDRPEIVKMFKKIILASYGEKSDDGKHFVKSEEKSKLFSCSNAYSEMFMEMITDENAAIEFVNGIVPKIEEPEGSSEPKA